MEYKRCSRGENCVNPLKSTDGLLPVSEFYKDTHLKDGLFSKCKLCSKVYNANRYKDDNNKKKSIENAKLWYRNNKIRALETHRVWRQSNRDKVRKYKIKSQHSHPESYKQWYLRIGGRSEYNKNYNAHNKLKRSVLDHNRRARLRALPNTLSSQDIQLIYSYWNNQCAINNDDCSGPLHLDHFIPLSDDGANPGTVSHNMMLLCQHHNLSKSNKNPMEWLTSEVGKHEALRIYKRLLRFNINFIAAP